MHGEFRRGWLVLALATLVMAPGCNSKPAPESQPSLTPLPAQWSFAGREGADRYRVQAWTGRRLLFEVTVPDTLVELTAALQRAAEPFADVVLEVRALDGQGQIVGEPWREALPSRTTNEKSE